MIVSLTGFMGCGKTGIGRELAALSGFRHIDLDEEVVSAAGKSIPEIFSEDGECVFREIESSCLRRVLGTDDNVILSLGGGTILNPEASALVHNGTVCFYLKASASNLRKWLSGSEAQRPLLAADKIEDMLSCREAAYERAAHFILDVNELSFTEAARCIMARINDIN